LQGPQSARREDEGEHPSHAERVKRPDEQEGWAGLGDLAAKNASGPITWITGMPNARSDPTSMMMYPDRRSSDTVNARVGTAEAGGSTLIAVPILVVWLYGTLVLAVR
jgi:hypothetical protein